MINLFLKKFHLQNNIYLEFKLKIKQVSAIFIIT